VDARTKPGRKHARKSRLASPGDDGNRMGAVRVLHLESVPHATGREQNNLARGRRRLGNRFLAAAPPYRCCSAISATARLPPARNCGCGRCCFAWRRSPCSWAWCCRCAGLAGRRRIFTGNLPPASGSPAGLFMLCATLSPIDRDHRDRPPRPPPRPCCGACRVRSGLFSRAARSVSSLSVVCV
jgi:hypothetical protein